MHRKLALALLFFAATILTSRAALVWTIGRDDNGWPIGDGGGPNATFVAEAGTNGLPGNPMSPETDRLADDDYYLAGVYTTVIPSNGTYTPIGLLTANEESAERAFAGTDNDKRYHFNLPNTLDPTDLLSITFDAFNFHIDPALNSDPRYGVEVYFNNVLVMPQLVLRPVDVDRNITTALFSQASVNAARGPGPDNIVYLKGINYNGAGGGNWMGVDFVQLDSQPVPEPSSAFMILCGALGVAPFLRRRRI